MLVVKVELHHAQTGEVSEIGRMIIANVGGDAEYGDYRVVLDAPRDRFLKEKESAKEKARSKALWDAPFREAQLTAAPRQRNVWHLVRLALGALRLP